jgi:hypothetical protein
LKSLDADGAAWDSRPPQKGPSICDGPELSGSLFFVNHFPNFQLNFEHERKLQAIATARFVEEHVAQTNQQVIVKEQK